MMLNFSITQPISGTLRSSCLANIRIICGLFSASRTQIGSAMPEWFAQRIALPTGTKDCPVGTVYIGCFLDGKTVTEHHVFEGARNDVRKAAVTAALELLGRCLEERGYQQ